MKMLYDGSKDAVRKSLPVIEAEVHAVNWHEIEFGVVPERTSAAK